MFESAELGHKLDKKRYKREAPKVRKALLDTQYELKQVGTFPVVVIIGGVDGAGKSETVNMLNAWMDPRMIQTRAFGSASEEERERPPMWRYWRALPPKGRIGILFGSWYTDPIIDRVLGRSKTSDLDQSLDDIARFERMLANEGVLLLKFWFHLSKPAQKKRLKELEKDPRTRWRVTDTDWKNFDRYDKFRKFSEHALRHTSTSEAPWTIVEGGDPYYRELSVARSILRAIRARLDHKAEARASRTSMDAPPVLEPIDGVQLLDKLDLSAKMSKDKYDHELEEWQGKLNLLMRHPKFRERAAVVVFEGNDAAGKGGAIRRITAALDARFYDVIPIAAPTEEERAQPYLWRFWRHIPRKGRLTIFDRSWYGRVLVERVEGYCSEYDWMRAYSEINDFEGQLASHDIAVVKFWLSISKEEQLKRFKEREKTGFKQYKITAEDFRNRKKWDAYALAANAMFERTSTDGAAWTLVEANEKHYARIKVLRTLTRSLEAML